MKDRKCKKAATRKRRRKLIETQERGVAVRRGERAGHAQDKSFLWSEEPTDQVREKRERERREDDEQNGANEGTTSVDPQSWSLPPD